MGIGSALGRCSLGFLADRLGKMMMLKICMLACGLTTLTWIGLNSFAVLAVYAFLYGMFSGGLYSLLPSVAADLFGVKKLGSLLGALYTSCCTGDLTAAPIGGFIFTATGNYTAAIIVAACLMLTGTTFLYLIDDTIKSNISSHKPVDSSMPKDAFMTTTRMISRNIRAGSVNSMDSASVHDTSVHSRSSLPVKTDPNAAVIDGGSIAEVSFLSTSGKSGKYHGVTGGDDDGLVTVAGIELIETNNSADDREDQGEEKQGNKERKKNILATSSSSIIDHPEQQGLGSRSGDVDDIEQGGGGAGGAQGLVSPATPSSSIINTPPSSPPPPLMGSTLTYNTTRRRSVSNLSLIGTVMKDMVIQDARSFKHGAYEDGGSFKFGLTMR
jgi:hypothetical protein